MVNLSQLKQQVKSSDLSRAVRNPGHPLAINDAYRQLKDLGWSCQNSEVHKTDRVPVFRLGDASIRRDRNVAGGWIVEVGESIYQTTTDLESITAEVQRLQAVAEDDGNSWGGSPAAQVAEVLTAEYPEHASRIARALELVEAGSLENQYNTRWDPAGFWGCYECDCPDSLHRQPRSKYGAACKHAFALLIARLVEGERQAAAYRKLADRIERDRARIAATKAGYEAALRPDDINRQAAHVYQVGPHRIK